MLNRARAWTAPVSPSCPLADEQHADHQLRVDRWTAARGIIRGQRPADCAQVQHRINLAEQVVCWDVPIEAELIKRMGRPVCKCFLFDELVSLLQRIRPRTKPPAKMEIRTF